VSSKSAWEPDSELGQEVHEGLRALAGREENAGHHVLAKFWRAVDERLTYAPIAGLELCAMVASGLRDEARCCELDGDSGSAGRLAAAADRVMERAWERWRKQA
jgi:hypothetical protein